MTEIDTDIRSTPDHFFDYWNKIFKFQLDVCANSENFKCVNYFDIKKDGLSQEWADTNWCNPPYSRGSLDKWLSKAIEQQIRGKTTVCLIPGDTSTGWYQKNILDSPMNSVLPVRKRLKFENSESGAKFASHIVIYWGYPL